MTVTVDPGTEVDPEHYRTELLGYCYRMLGSAFDAEDAVQDALVRAWKSRDSFEGRASMRTWLYRIATNVCLDLIGSRSRRARPYDLSGTSWQPIEASLAGSRAAEEWLEPMPDGWLFPAGDAVADPAEVIVRRESVRLAFVAALQYLPARQRAVLVLRDVLRWKAAEVAELLDTTVASVNSALQRAHAALAERRAEGSVADAGAEVGGSGPAAEIFDELDSAQTALLDRYVDAFERYDMQSFVSLLHEDVLQNMPPYEMWLSGPQDVVAWMLGPGAECRGSRLIRTVANGQPAFAQYRLAADGSYFPWGLQVLDVRDGSVRGISTFLDTRVFALHGLPDSPPDAGAEPGETVADGPGAVRAAR
ncbi:sigma-70 family RNA polymerase sigma factor [Nakamurella sp. YIM 132087]|uniref:Sigma-70 family RNA polymerase sigma factor n=1 Tax=Nakamurella alba TaxID=2665158 RepID=A0A7K1FVP2_9ACTN|nr:sigma-70 family RNA polymerase sigma factor [Nakamurella alba]MTD17283.1 sigma-70 family RNA polymerase sigma factor [Nakamurella alba]